MRKRMFSVFVSATLLASFLTACSGTGTAAPAATASEPAEETAPGDTESDAGNIEEAGPVQFDGEKIVMGVVTYTGALPGTQRISDKISEYTKEKYGIEFELQPFGFADYTQNATLMLTSGEQLDIFTGLSIGYSSVVNKDFCLDLEENGLLDTYGKGIKEQVSETELNAARINGHLYGIPNKKDSAAGLETIEIGSTYLDEIGFDYDARLGEGEEIIYTDWDEIDSIFAQLHEAIPDMYVFAPLANTAQYMLYDAIGGDNFGVLMDPVNDLTVSNLFESDAFHDYCARVYKWNQLGYISQDALTSDVTGAECVKAGTAMANPLASKPGITTQQSGMCGQRMIMFQCGPDFTRSSGIASMPWCINSNTENPEAAMTILNGFFSDPVLSNLLIWGEEGVEYQKTEDGHITFADGVDSTTSEWYTSCNWEMPNQFIAHIWEGDPMDIWDKTIAFNNESLMSKANGFTFDNSDVSAEYTALVSVENEYLKTLLFGFSDPDSEEDGIPAFNKALEGAGLQTYMEAKQEAINAWAEANGIE